MGGVVCPGWKARKATSSMLRPTVAAKVLRTPSGVNIKMLPVSSSTTNRLSAPSKAVPILKKHPNEPLVKLLITNLETFPNDWVEEGWEDLLPNLKKLLHAKSK